MNVYLPNKRLPSIYQEVEYIQSSGTQYINTGYTPTTSTRFSVSYNISSKPYEYACLFGARNVNSSASQSFYLGWRNGTSKKGLLYILAPSVDYGGVSFGGNVGIDYNISFDGNTLTDGTNSISISYNSSPTGTLYIFANHDLANSAAADYAYAKLYNLKLYQGTTLVRDFVPCYRKSDSVIGLYDLVNNQFYTNAGTGTFSKGNDVTMVELKNAYIGEVWTPGSNTVAYFPFTINQLDEVGNAVIGVTGTKQSLGYNFNFSYDATISNITTARFCCFWVKFGTIKYDEPNQTPTLGFGELTYNYYHDTAAAFSKTFSYQYSSSGRNHSNSYNTNSGQWYFLAYGYTGTNVVAYFNGAKVMDVQASLYNGTKRHLGHSIDETLSELIFEDRCRTAQEISDYYNHTKSNYGL